MLIGVAGALGAVLRTSVGMWMGEGSSFPIATFLVNMIATGVLCFLATGALHHVLKRKESRQVVTGGFLGSFSTFSAFSIETILLFESGQGITAVIYILVSLIGGISIGLAGFHYGRKWQVK